MSNKLKAAPPDWFGEFTQNFPGETNLMYLIFCENPVLNKHFNKSYPENMDDFVIGSHLHEKHDNQEEGWESYNELRLKYIAEDAAKADERYRKYKGGNDE